MDKMVFIPGEVKEVARQHGYEEVPVGENERNYLLRFRHPSKQGCGGTTNQEWKIQDFSNILFIFCFYRLVLLRSACILQLVRWVPR